MEERYYEIFEYLQECVDNDIYTEAEAQEIADIAYDRYMIESEADSELSIEDVKAKRKALAKKIAVSVALTAAAAGIIVAIKKYSDKRTMLKEFENSLNIMKEKTAESKKFMSEIDNELKSKNLSVNKLSKIRKALETQEADLNNAINDYQTKVAKVRGYERSHGNKRILNNEADKADIDSLKTMWNTSKKEKYIRQIRDRKKEDAKQIKK